MENQVVFIKENPWQNHEKTENLEFLLNETHWNESFCIEKAYIKKWKTSSSRKMIFLGDDVFRYANLFTVIHINSFQYEKCVFFKLKIW